MRCLHISNWRQHETNNIYFIVVVVVVTLQSFEATILWNGRLITFAQQGQDWATCAKWWSRCVDHIAFCADPWCVWAWKWLSCLWGMQWNSVGRNALQTRKISSARSCLQNPTSYQLELVQPSWACLWPHWERVQIFWLFYCDQDGAHWSLRGCRVSAPRNGWIGMVGGIWAKSMAAGNFKPCWGWFVGCVLCDKILQRACAHGESNHFPSRGAWPGFWEL